MPTVLDVILFTSPVWIALVLVTINYLRVDSSNSVIHSRKTFVKNENL